MSKLIIQSSDSDHSESVDLTQSGATEQISDAMRRIVNRNLLKYAAGRQMFCPVPDCGAILDWKTTVLVEKPDGSHAGICCASCFDTKRAGKPLPEGYRVIRHGKAKAPKADKPAFPQKPGRGLNAYLRKDIFKAFKRQVYCTKQDRLFPDGYGHGIKLNETVQDDGSIDIWYSDNAEYSAYQIAEYVRKYCELNHLTGGA